MNNKTLLLALGLLLTQFGFSQNKPKVLVNSPQYDSLKTLNILEFYEVMPDKSAHMQWNASGVTYQPKSKKKGTGIKPKASGCNCYIEPDATYTLAMGPNDDGSSSVITLPFDFCFYGDTVTQLYINNNGNITFGNSLAAFSATAFPSNNNQIISPFWADVDTRAGNGQVLYKLTPTALYVNWVDVGYYNQQGDKRNTFQLIITDGADPVIDGGNVAFCYEDMQWTTGSASSGVNGFGGIPATAGANKGNNIDYFLIARFDHPGTDFDGALGNPDGISWLDYKSFFFDVCNTSNIPPVPNGISSCDTFRICSVGDTADYPVIFLSPENNQITSLSINNGGLTTMQTLVNNSGNTAEMVIRAWGDASTVGTYNVTVTATDNFSPPGVTNLTFTIVIDSTGTSNFNPVLSPLSGCDSVELQVLNGPYDSYLWPDITTDTSKWVNSSQTGYSVTVEKDGCFKKITENILIAESFNMNLQGNLNLCPDVTGANVFFPDSLDFGPITWGLTDPSLDSLYSNTLSPGTYTVVVQDTLGICSIDTTFTVSNYQPIQLQADDSICGNQISFNNGTGGTGAGSWTYYPLSLNPIIQSPNNINTVVNFSQTATYYFVYTDQNCPTADTIHLTVSMPFGSQLQGSTFYCPDDPGAYVFVQDSARFGTVTWGADPGLNGIFSHFLSDGQYSLYLQDTLGLCASTQNFTVSTQPPVNLMQDTVICDSVFVMTTNQGPTTQGKWSVVSGPGNVQFQDSTVLNQTLILPNYGVYVLVFKEETCQDDDTLVVTYDAGPVIQFNNVDYFVCPGQLESIHVVDSVNQQSAQWTNVPAGLDTLFSVLLDTGTYSLTLTNQFGCSNDTTFNIEGQPKIVLDTIDIVCYDTVYYQNGVGVEGGNWSMLTGPGNVQFLPNDSLMTYMVFSEFGTYTLRYGETNCQDADTLLIDVVLFPYSEVADIIGCIGVPEEAVAYDVIGNAVNFYWSNGDSGPSTILNQGGTYMLTTENACGIAEFEFEFSAEPCDINMPNVFTPNGDFANNLFVPIAASKTAFPKFFCQIFNRWGNLIYEFDDMEKGWDGTTKNGNLANDGVYFFKVSATNLNGEEFEKEGFFHLIRN